MDVARVKREVALANRVLAETGLADGVLISLGHASQRLSDPLDRFVVKGRGYALDAHPAMRAADMQICDQDGFLIAGPPGSMQCSEVMIHARIYHARPDVNAVVHTHARFTVLASVLGYPLVPMCKEGPFLVRDPIPVYPHTKIVNSSEEGDELAAALGDADVALMTGHGAVTVGTTLEAAVTNMMLVEEQAKMNWYAQCAAGPGHPRIADKLLDEVRDAAPYWELPHFKATMTGRPHRDGRWSYYTSVVAGGVDS